MGCFSYLCKECGEAVLSDSATGDPVRLFRLKKGKVVQEMRGQYDSYGRVFTPDFKSSVEWEGDWCEIVDEHFNDDPSTGIAAVHERCCKPTTQTPTTLSDNDPNQGWGTDDDWEYDEDY